MTMHTTARTILMAAMALAVVWGSPAPAADKTVKIGLLAPITGPNPDWGKKQVIGLQTAVDRINRRGGIMGTPLSTAIRDTGGDADKAAAAYREMAGDEQLLAVIGPLYSSTFGAVAAISSRHRLVTIATASAKPGMSDLAKRPFAFRMTVTSDKKEAPLAQAWTAAHHIQSVVVVYTEDNAVWSTLAEKLWPDIMAGLKVDILNRSDPISFKTGQTDFASVVKQIAGYRPDGICIAALSAEAGPLLREIRRQGLDQPVLGASGTANPMTIDLAGEAAEGLWSVSLFYLEDPNPKVQDYVGAFQNRCKAAYPEMDCVPEQYDVVVHDILNFLADVMKRKMVTGDPARLETERDKVRDGLTRMRVWRGTAGMMAFDQKGDGIRSVHILKVENGQWRSVR